MQRNTTSTRIFYQGGKPVTLVKDDEFSRIFRSEDLAFAEQKTQGTQTSGLLMTDDKGSVLGVQENT